MSRLDERSLAVDCPLSHFRDSMNGCICFSDEMPRQQLSAYKAQAKAKGRKAEGEAPKRGRKPKDTAPAHVAPPKIEAKWDGDLLDALKALKGLVSAHGADKMKSMVDLLS